MTLDRSASPAPAAAAAAGPEARAFAAEPAPCRDALESSCRSLTQSVADLQRGIVALILRSKETGESIRKMARRLVNQAAALQALGSRMTAMEYRMSTHVPHDPCRASPPPPSPSPSPPRPASTPATPPPPPPPPRARNVSRNRALARVKTSRAPATATATQSSDESGLSRARAVSGSSEEQSGDPLSSVVSDCTTECRESTSSNSSTGLTTAPSTASTVSSSCSVSCSSLSSSSSSSFSLPSPPRSSTHLLSSSCPLGLVLTRSTSCSDGFAPPHWFSHPGAHRPRSHAAGWHAFVRLQRRAARDRRLLETALAEDAREVLDAGADADFTSGGVWSVLHRASARARADLVASLLKGGARCDLKNINGFTALHLAARYDPSGRCVKLLLDAGADPTARNRFGRTALHYAARFGNARAVRALLEARACARVAAVDARRPHGLPRGHRVRRLLLARPRLKDAAGQPGKRGQSRCTRAFHEALAKLRTLHQAV